MTKLKLFLILLLLSSPLANGQNSGKVIVYQGRRVPFKAQKIIDLSFRNLKEVPVMVSNTEVEILNLDNNNLAELPSWIGNLKNLKILSVRNNNLLVLNSKLSFCENLEQLYLSGNKNLSDIPSLSFCENLEIIDVVDTGINEVPGWVELLDSLFFFKYTTK
jgi:Leucine-rich repeat (LRR) protein